VFTGIVEATGVIRQLITRERSAWLTVDAGSIRDGITEGDSVAVSGVCLTVVRLAGTSFDADLSVETLHRTTLGRLGPGSAVNLERPLAVGDRLGGHVVQGHVDGVGCAVCRWKEGDAWWVEISAPPPVMRYVVEKGSIAVDGVSLTVAGVSGGRFTVCLIPHTCEVTTLGALKTGAEVNLEVDVLAKYVERLMASSAVATARAPRAAGNPAESSENPEEDQADE
jgi:riboflavin synthase